MGWDYRDHRAYGIEIDVWNHPNVKQLLEKHQDVLRYRREMAFESEGFLFVYVESTYEIINLADGSYRSGKLDTDGTDFEPPAHPIFHYEETDRPKPELTVDEISAMEEVKKFCNSTADCVWIRHARVTY